MLSYFMRTYCIREKYEKYSKYFKLYYTTTEILQNSSIIQQFTIEYYNKKSYKILLSYTNRYQNQSNTSIIVLLYGKVLDIIKEDKLSPLSISNLQWNIIKESTTTIIIRRKLNDRENYRKYNMQQKHQYKQHQQPSKRKTYSNQESNKIGAENSIERKFEIFHYSTSRSIDITNLLQLLSTKQFILSENNIKSIAIVISQNITTIIIIILYKIKVKKLRNLWKIIFYRINIDINKFQQSKLSINSIIIITKLFFNNEINVNLNNTTITKILKEQETMSPIMETIKQNSNLSNIEILKNNIMKIDYSLISEEINDTFTPAMSQVILAPTVNSAIHLQTPSTIAAVVSGSTSNSFQINGNGTDDGINSFYFYETEQFALLWVLFTVIVLGNSAVLVTLFMNKNRKSRMNFFIKQLALADICVGLLNVLTDIIWRITVSWRAGNLACKLIRFSQVCVTYASTYVLVALSIDRYDAITHPMNFSGSWQRARRLVISAWAVSAIFSSPMLILYEEKLIQGQTQCWIELGESWRWQLYMSLVAVTLFAFPALIISACYANIVRTIWVKGSLFIPSERTGRNSACLASRRASSRGIIPRAKVKTVKMTFVIVIVFIVCWSPYIIFDLLQVFNQIPRTQTNIAIATFMQSLAPLNSAANPLIYCLFSTQVCRALKRIPPFRWILCSCCCQKQGHNSAPIRCTTVGQRLHNSCDSMRTLTTSLNVSRRSNNCMRPARVVIVERPKTILAMSEV